MAKPHNDGRTACYNSPYGQLVKDYLVEVVSDIGFDGVWLDCSHMSWIDLTPRVRRWACCCEYCIARYRAETGEALPTKTDWASPAFRRWVRWRSERFTRLS